MKSPQFKKIIKEAVKEAIQEELKDILLEAVKAPKSQPINENISNNTISSKPIKIKPLPPTVFKFPGTVNLVIFVFPTPVLRFSAILLYTES